MENKRIIIVLLVACFSPCLAQTNCKTVLDAVFVVDGSNSINRFNYATMINSLLASLTQFDLDPLWSRIGVVQFSYKDSMRSIPLSSDINYLRTEIEKFRDHPDTSTDTDYAIRNATSMLMASKRTDIPQMIILMTDGYGNYPNMTMAEVGKAKTNRITMITVGMKDKMENKDMASDQSSDMFVLTEWPLVINRMKAMAALYCPPPDCTRGVNMMFVVDGSSSVFYMNFKLTTDAVINTSLAFWKNYTASNLGVVVFGTTVVAIIPLTNDKTSFQNRLNSVEYPDTGTFTWLAIDEATRQLASAPPPVSGSEVMPKVMVVITDGDSENQNKTIEAANIAKAQNITIFGIGVGRSIDITKLRQITSDELGDVILVKNFTELATQLTPLVSGLCVANPVIITRPTVTTVSPTTVTTTPATGPRVDTSTVCNRTMDLVFVMDASSGVGSSNLPLITSAVYNASLYFLSGVTPKSRVRVMTYSSGVNFDLGPYITPADLQAALSQMIFIPGTRATNVALTQVAQDIMADQKAVNRTGVPSAVVVILAGQSDFPAEASVIANALVTQQGVKVFSLGISSAVTDAELRGLTFNVSGRSSWAADYAALPDTLNQMARTVCYA